MVPLPVLVFEDLATVDFSKVWDVKFVLFCFIVTMISITISFLISCLLGDKTIRGEFIQAAYRSSAALLGIAFIQNIYGNAGMAPLMIIGSVPLYNMMAVVVLSVFKPGQSGLDRTIVKKTIKGIVTNPILYRNCCWTCLVSLKIPMPAIPKRLFQALEMSPLNGTHGDGRYLRYKKLWKDQTICHCCFYETYWSLCHFPANCSETWIPYR